MKESLQATIEAVEASNPSPSPEGLQADDQTAIAIHDQEQHKTAEAEHPNQSDHDAGINEDGASHGKDDSQEHRQGKGVGKRINELTREKYEERRRAESAERRAEAAERRAQELEQQRLSEEGSKGNEAVRPDGKPKLENYGYDQEAYLDALHDWRLSQRQSEQDAQEQSQEKIKQGQERHQKFQERLSKYEGDNPGKWEAATKAPINFTDPMLYVVTTSDVGPQIAVYLSENLDKADEISRLTPYAAAAALGRLEAAMTEKSSIAPPRPPKTFTKANPPVPTLSGSSPVRKDLASMDVADHLEAVRAKKLTR